MKSPRLICSLFAIAFLTNCSGTYTHTLKSGFSAQEPIRVAVLPFAQVNESGAVLKEDGSLLLDQVGLVSSELKATPAQIVRKQVLAELSKTALDVVSPALIDIEIPHHGLAKPDGTPDLEKIHSIDPQKVCKEFVDCDAVLLGSINRWSRNYYGIQSVSSVGIALKLVSAKDGSTLFELQAQDSESRGISKVPTGFSDLVLEPIKGLDSEIIVKLSQSMVQKMLSSLTSESKPLFLDQAPPAIYASSHSGTVRNGPMVVVVFGSPHQQASFSIGKVIRRVPMIERIPGHYYGEYIPLEGDTFKNQNVTVALSDNFGRSTSQEVPKGAVSFP